MYADVSSEQMERQSSVLVRQTSQGWVAGLFKASARRPLALAHQLRQLRHVGRESSNSRSWDKALYVGTRRYAPWVIPEPNYCLAKLVRS